MDFQLPEEVRLFQETMREFCQREIAPHAETWDREGRFPKELFKQMGSLGYLGVALPAAEGGSGLGALGAAIMAEEMAYASAGVAVGIYVHAFLALCAIHLFGTESQKENYLLPGIKGTKIGCWGFAEPQTGSDPEALRCRAVRDGRGNFLINGQKMFITNGPFADFVVLTAALSPEKKSKGLGLILVDQGIEGFSAKKLETFGVRCAETASLFFDGCAVPEENLLGEREIGFGRIANTLTLGRIIAAGIAIGLSLAAYDAALTYAKERIVFGRPISKNQGISWTLAEMALKIETSRLLTYKAALAYDRGMPHLLETSMAKLHATVSCTKICEQALQIHGGAGFLMDSPVQRFYRDCKLLEIGEGTSQIQRDLIGKLLGL